MAIAELLEVAGWGFGEAGPPSIWSELRIFRRFQGAVQLRRLVNYLRWRERCVTSFLLYPQLIIDCLAEWQSSYCCRTGIVHSARVRTDSAPCRRASQRSHIR